MPDFFPQANGVSSIQGGSFFNMGLWKKMACFMVNLAGHSPSSWTSIYGPPRFARMNSRWHK
ncbi:MAG: hypothetical protein H7833_19265, partial [Magnetococcus sp. DMHC-1]